VGKSPGSLITELRLISILSISGTIHQCHRCCNVMNGDKFAFAFQVYNIQHVTDIYLSN